MDPAAETNSEVVYEFPDLIRKYEDSNVQRFMAVADVVPPSIDPDTGVTSKDVVIDPATGVSARLYLPANSDDSKQKPLPVLVYYHGGGFFLASADARLYHNYINSLVAKANVVAVSVNYRLAPKHPIPAAYDDSWQALQWVMSATDEWLADRGDMERVFVAGDSAGANIAHHMMLRAGETGVLLKGMLLVHPYFWGPRRAATDSPAVEESIINHYKALDELWPFVCPGAAVGVEDPRLNPMAEGAPSLAALGCRRAMVTVASKDLLRDWGLAYYEALKKSGWGGELEEVLESEGEDHDFHLFAPECEKALEKMERMVAFLNH